MERVSRTVALVAAMCGLIGLGGFALRAALAAAATPSNVRVGSAPGSPSGSKVVGSLSSATRMQVSVFLNSQDPAGLAAYATDVATPGSSIYHQYLTVPQFAQRFGAAPAQVQAVESALRADGLHPGQATPNDLSVPVTATAAQFEKAFSTGIENVRLRGGRTAFTNTSAPLLPASVAGTVQNVTGLDNLVLAQPEGLPTPVPARTSDNATANAVHPNVGSGPQPCSTLSANDKSSPGPYTADQIANAYGLTSLYSAGDEGSGQTIALYELQPYTTSDITTYESCYSITGNTPTVKKCSSCTLPPTSAGNDESELDIEDVIGLAPKASVEVYEGKNGTDNITLMQGIVTDNTAKVISTSWGECESSWGSANAASENTIFEEAATQGQTIFAAAGDQGSEACGGTGSLAVGDPASQPYVTGVGGTSMTSAAPPPTESVWNAYDGSNSGKNEDGGGGISSFWTMPTYQSGAKASLGVIQTLSSGTPCTAASGDCREVPDVTADASVSTGYLIYYSPEAGGTDGWYDFGGTSAAAPTWAAYIALVNASSGCYSTPVGFANPDLYSIASKAWSGTAYTADFNDITVGNNNPLNYESPGNEGPYSALVGYDMASGLGSPQGAALATALCAPKAIGTAPVPSISGVVGPTGVTVDRTNHIAYVAESMSNAVAEIVKTNTSYFYNPATNVSSTLLPSLNFPDDLALDSSGRVYASDFCVGTKVGVCSGESSGTTAAVTQQTSGSAGQADTMTGCSYPSGNAIFGTSSPTLFVACAGSGAVDACTVGSGTDECGSARATLTMTGTAPVPSGVAAIPTETTTPAVVVADAKNNTVSVVSLSGTTLSESTPVSLTSGCRPANVAIGPLVSTTATVYVACPGTGQVEVGTVSNASTPVLGSFTATTLPTTGTNTPAPYGVAVNAAGTLLVVTDSANNDAVAYPSLSGSTLGTGTVVSVGTTPDGVGIDGGNAFVANEGSNNVSVVDPSQRGRNHGHYASQPSWGSNAATSAAVSLSPLIAPLPAGSSG